MTERIARQQIDDVGFDNARCRVTEANKPTR